MVGKYEFENKQHAKDVVEKLGVDEKGNPTHNHSIVMLGNLILENAITDENGEVIQDAIFSVGYAVDVLWENEPLKEWEQFRIYPTNAKHSFAGVKNK